MKQKSRATRYSEAISEIGILRDTFENMQTALNDVGEAIETKDVAETADEKLDAITTLGDKIAVAEKIIAENSGAFDEIDSGVFEELRDELQNWRDNLPENLQSSSKADTLDESVSSLEEVIQFVEDITSASGDFSGASGFEAEAVQTRLDALETAIENIDNLECTDVEFPGMFG